MTEEQKKLSEMTAEEFGKWATEESRKHAVTVNDYVRYLLDNFKPTDKICYMDCVEGLRNDCTYITVDMLGKSMFRYVKDVKKVTADRLGKTPDDVADMFMPEIHDNDVLVI